MLHGPFASLWRIAPGRQQAAAVKSPLKFKGDLSFDPAFTDQENP